MKLFGEKLMRYVGALPDTPAYIAVESPARRTFHIVLRSGALREVAGIDIYLADGSLFILGEDGIRAAVYAANTWDHCEEVRPDGSIPSVPAL